VIRFVSTSFASSLTGLIDYLYFHAVLSDESYNGLKDACDLATYNGATTPYFKSKTKG